MIKKNFLICIRCEKKLVSLTSTKSLEIYISLKANEKIKKNKNLPFLPNPWKPWNVTRSINGILKFTKIPVSYGRRSFRNESNFDKISISNEIQCKKNRVLVQTKKVNK